MIDSAPSETPEEISLRNSDEYLQNLGKSPPWQMAIAACIMGGGAFFTRKRAKKINSITVIPSEAGPENSDPSPLSSLPRLLRHREISRPCSFSCAPEQARKIFEIVEILHTYSAIGLLKGGWVGHLRKLEEEIDNVPALNFLWTIFSNHALKEKVQGIFNDTWKIGHQQGFLTGIDKGMRRYSREKLNLDLDPWARSLKVSKAAAQHLIQKNDWKGLVNLLLSTHRAL